MIEVCRQRYHADPECNVVLLRYFNPVGAHESGIIGEDPKGVPNNLMPYISQVAIGKRDHLNVFGNDYPTPDGTGVRDYIAELAILQSAIVTRLRLLMSWGGRLRRLWRICALMPGDGRA